MNTPSVLAVEEKPISCPPTRKFTTLPGSAVPSKTGLLLLVINDSVVITGCVIAGWAGAVVSIVIDSPSDGTEVLPASSVAVTVIK